jgi:hypothetical protein
MNSPPPAYTPRQLMTFKVLQRNRMAWVMFLFLMAVFTAVLWALAYAVFWANAADWIKAVFALLDGIVGWSIKQVVSYLFPSHSAGNDHTNKS